MTWLTQAQIKIVFLLSQLINEPGICIKIVEIKDF